MKKLMVYITVFGICCSVAYSQNSNTNKLPHYMEELTAPDFVKAVQQSSGVCLIPFGVIEKHAAHLPLGTDLYEARKYATTAAEKEYCVVFPPYFAGQVNCARHQPGTIAYSHETIWNLLQETCDELSRNGFKKIIIVNGHGGNNSFVQYFIQSQLHSQKDYVVMLFQSHEDSEITKIKNSLRETSVDGHAGELETSMMRAIRPDLVKLEAAGLESGEDKARLAHVPYQFTGIWWYAKFPDHYCGDGTHSSLELGKFNIETNADQLVKLIRIIKQSSSIEDLQNQFYKDAQFPLKTKQ